MYVSVFNLTRQTLPSPKATNARDVEREPLFFSPFFLSPAAPPGGRHTHPTIHTRPSARVVFLSLPGRPAEDATASQVTRDRQTVHIHPRTNQSKRT